VQKPAKDRHIRGYSYEVYALRIDYEMLVVESILHHWVDIADAGTLGIAVDHLAGEFDPVE
jgi:hypothetical protein